MKKIVLTIAIALVASVGAKAQSDYYYGSEYYAENYYIDWSGITELFEMLTTMEAFDWSSFRSDINDIGLPDEHGLDWHQSGESEVPLAGGTLLLIGLGGAYATIKRRKE